MGVRQVGVIRDWDFTVLADTKEHDCEFVGACPAFLVTAGEGRHVTSLRLAREHAWPRQACPCVSNAQISPGVDNVFSRSTLGGETVRPSHQSVSNPVARVSAALSQLLCAGRTDRMEPSRNMP